MTYIQQLMNLSIRARGIINIFNVPMMGGGIVTNRAYFRRLTATTDVSSVAITYITQLCDDIDATLSLNETFEPIEWFTLPIDIKRAILTLDENVYNRLASHIDNFDDSIQELLYQEPFFYNFIKDKQAISQSHPIIHDILNIGNRLQQIKLAKELEQLGYTRAANIFKNEKEVNKYNIDDVFLQIFDDMKPLLYKKVDANFSEYLERAKNHNMINFSIGS